MVEAGLAGFEAQGWSMICAPSATPTATINKLANELEAAAGQPEVRDLIVRIGMVPVKSPPPDQLKGFLASEIERWGRLIERAGAAKSL